MKRQVAAKLVLHLAGGEKIETTQEHPFYVEGKGFIKAGALGIGNSIVTRAGPSIKIEQVERVAQPTTVYNLRVEGFHTYFVGLPHSGLWVHNADDCPEETYYRAMSNKEYERFQQNDGTLSIKETGGLNREIFVTPSLDYAQGKLTDPRYDVVVKFNMQSGTTDALTSVGARNDAPFLEERGLGGLPPISGVNNPNIVHVKGEDGNVNLGLRRGTVNLFNRNISSWETLP